MPKRVHSASDHDDNGESKRTRKPTELVCQLNIHHYFYISFC